MASVSHMAQPARKNLPPDSGPDFGAATRRLLFGKQPEIPGSGTSAAKIPRRHTKVKVTINLDGDLVQYFKDRAEEDDLGYQLLINRALREFVEGNKTEQLAKEIGQLLGSDPSFIELISQKISS